MPTARYHQAVTRQSENSTNGLSRDETGALSWPAVFRCDQTPDSGSKACAPHLRGEAPNKSSFQQRHDVAASLSLPSLNQDVKTQASGGLRCCAECCFHHLKNLSTFDHKGQQLNLYAGSKTSPSNLFTNKSLTCVSNSGYFSFSRSREANSEDRRRGGPEFGHELLFR